LDATPHPPDATAPSVELLHWPADADRREELRREGRPRLLLLGPDDLPPGQTALEDWIRLPASERDVSARIQRLVQRAEPTDELHPGEVVVDEGGIARWARRSVALSPTEAKIVHRLAQAPGRLVTRDQLVTALWGDRPHQPHSLDSRIHRVRVRLQALGLEVRTIRGRGFVLTTTTSADPT